MEKVAARGAYVSFLYKLAKEEEQDDVHPSIRKMKKGLGIGALVGGPAGAVLGGGIGAYSGIKDAPAWHKAMAAKKQEKKAFAVTEEGHQWDAEKAEEAQRFVEEYFRRLQDKGAMGWRNPEGNKSRGGFFKSLRFGSVTDMPNPRRLAYIAKKHREGKNAWNPFGGLWTPTEAEGPGASKWNYGRFGEGKKKEEEGKTATAAYAAFLR